MTKVSMTVNGRPMSGEVEGRTLLVSFLRDQQGLTGTHVGCDTSQCGACVVHVDGKAVTTPWGDNPKFGTCFYEVQSAGWVRNVAFSPAGDTLAYCSHNSTVR